MALIYAWPPLTRNSFHLRKDSRSATNLSMLTRKKNSFYRKYPLPSHTITPYFRPKWLESIPILRPKPLKNHTLWGRTYLYSPYKGNPPPFPCPNVLYQLTLWFLKVSSGYDHLCYLKQSHYIYQWTKFNFMSLLLGYKISKQMIVLMK